MHSSCLIIAAHPDDEVIGASTALHDIGDVTVLHVTDGAPRDRRFWSPRARGPRASYAEQRAGEGERALALAGIAPRQIRRGGFFVQEVSFQLVELTHALADLIAELEPRWVLVQPYEGGHPDHDACAFAACAALTGRAAADPALLEMTAYHRAGEGLETGCFLNRVTTESVRALSPEQQDLKSRMLACFETQAEILREFRVAEERFRVAPRYDFTKPPHPGPLHYESLGWPMSAGRWCELASEAWEKLQLEQRAK